jgi:hypothetical protein
VSAAAALPPVAPLELAVAVLMPRLRAPNAPVASCVNAAVACSRNMTTNPRKKETTPLGGTLVFFLCPCQKSAMTFIYEYEMFLLLSL